VVEKDYVLGWMLHAIARDPLLGTSWVFKGGTCLKKCYFETYRFSEDLDFTVTDPAQLDEDFLLGRFRAIGAQLYDETGIEIPAELLRFKVWSGKFGRPAGEGRVSYRGPIAPRGGDLPRIKIDLTADEVLVLPPVIRSASHAYSDVPADGMAVRCYAFEEVFGEKVRASASGPGRATSMTLSTCSGMANSTPLRRSFATSFARNAGSREHPDSHLRRAGGFS
jgi:hypothetical protein